MTHYLYRHFDAAGKLLYVGVTEDLDKRNVTHCKSSNWKDRIAKITHEEFERLSDAIKAEAQAISDEQPEFNKNGSGGNKIPCLFRLRRDLVEQIANESAATNINKTRLVELALGNYFAVKR